MYLPQKGIFIIADCFYEETLTNDPFSYLFLRKMNWFDNPHLISSYLYLATL